MEFDRGRGHTTVFHHACKDNKTRVHGDGHLSAGTKEALDWLEFELKKMYQTETQRVCADHRDKCEAGILNKHGYELEADPRHAELIVEQMLASESRTTLTPGIERCEPKRRCSVCGSRST